VNELLDLISQWPIDRATVLLAAAAISVLTFLLYMGVRYTWTAFVPPAPPPDPEDEPLLYQGPNKKPGAADRLDGAFEHLVRSTGLDLSADQAAAWLLLAAVCFATAAFLARPEWWMGLIGFLVGGLGTFGVYLFYRSQYRWKIQDQLPDVFFMMARSTRAGLSLEHAIELVGQQDKIAVAKEFRRCTAQIELGLPVVVALERVAHRVRLLDFNALVSLCALYRKGGGDLPLLLERLAASTRDHNQFRSHLRSVTALGRISAGCIAMATPVILLAYAIFQPDYAQAFFESRPGWTTVGIALSFELVGAFWLSRILKVEA
jgi:tight adherence protein B